MGRGRPVPPGAQAAPCPEGPAEEDSGKGRSHECEQQPARRRPTAPPPTRAGGGQSSRRRCDGSSSSVGGGRQTQAWVCTARRGQGGDDGRILFLLSIPARLNFSFKGTVALRCFSTGGSGGRKSPRSQAGLRATGGPGAEGNGTRPASGLRGAAADPSPSWGPSCPHETGTGTAKW